MTAGKPDSKKSCRIVSPPRRKMQSAVSRAFVGHHPQRCPGIAAVVTRSVSESVPPLTLFEVAFFGYSSRGLAPRYFRLFAKTPETCINRPKKTVSNSSPARRGRNRTRRIAVSATVRTWHHPYLDRECFISVYLAANRNNRGTSPRDFLVNNATSKLFHRVTMWKRTACYYAGGLWQSREAIQQQFVETLCVSISHEQDIRRPFGDAPIIGDRHAQCQFTGRFDRDIDVATFEEIGS
jgi:hypothetical protein